MYLFLILHVQTDSLGNILDLRNKATAPCLTNFAQMDLQELKNLCISAYEKQMTSLIAAEGEETKLLGILKGELKEVSHDIDIIDNFSAICIMIFTL